MAALTSFPMPAERAARVDRYLRIVYWARRRYSRNGAWLVRGAGGAPSRYTLIEDAAAAKLLRTNRRYAPGTAPAREG
jgi:hypothetical protein